jgi:hypothetical protein
VQDAEIPSVIVQGQTESDPMKNRYCCLNAVANAAGALSVAPLSDLRCTTDGRVRAKRPLLAVVVLWLCALVLPAGHGATIGFEVSEGWVVGQPPPVGSGCTLSPGYGSAPGVVAQAEGQSLALPLSAVANFAISMPTSGVQHISVELSFTSPPYTTGFYRDWRGLDFGYLHLLTTDTPPLAGIVLPFDASAWNSAPTSYMNNEDLIIKTRYFGDQSFSTPFASPAAYRFDFAFDYAQNTTTFTMFAAGGTTPLASHVWTGTFKVGAIQIMSRAWYYGTPAEGTTTFVDNLFVGTMTTPTTVALTSSGTPAAVGAPVTFTATVSGSTPTGNVTFYDGATALGSSAVNASAQATITTSSLARGTHSITAQYAGDANNTASTSSPLTQEVLTQYALITAAAPVSGGSVTGGGTYFEGSQQTIMASPQGGWKFDNWTGDATGTVNPLSVLMDANRTITGNFSHDTRDGDGDGLSNYDEVVTYGTDPAKPDTDGDGFDDGFEVKFGYSPVSPASTPDGVATILTAVEFRFNAAQGVSYRIETSTDLENWSAIEPVIIGQGAVVTRFYSTESQTERYFRAVRN